MNNFDVLSDAGKALCDILKGDPLVVDVRTPEEFRQGHYKGTVNIPLQEISRHRWGAHQHQDIVVYCRSGYRSDRAKKILLQNGFPSVLNGGNQSTLENLSKS